MPILNVKIGAERSRETTERVAELLLDLSSRVLRKPAQVTAIAISYIHPEDWIIAGKSLAEHHRKSFYVDIKVTDETNTKPEKAQFVREVFDGFRKILGDLHEESYVYIEDVRAAAYGYGGQTQEWRYHHPSS